MPLRNTPERFGSAAKLLHWSMALAIVVAYVAIYYTIWILGGREARHPDRPMIINIHWVAGILVGVFVLPRLWWRSRNVQPDSAPGSRLEHFAAQATHWLLYAFMILMPLTGYFGTRGPGYHFGLFDLPSFRDTATFAWIGRTFEVTWTEFEAPLDVVHHFVGKWVLWIAIGLHAGAALFHHLIRRDATLVRMLPGD